MRRLDRFEISLELAEHRYIRFALYLLDYRAREDENDFCLLNIFKRCYKKQ